MEEFYTTKQIAKILGVNIVTVRRWIQNGSLPAIYLGEKSKEYRVRKTDFEKFIEEREVKK